MKKLLTTILILLFTNSVYAAIDHDKAVELQKAWDRISFEIKDQKQQKKEFQSLSETAENYLNQYPDSAEIKAWAGIILSTEAGFYKLNIPKAIKKITRAKDVLEQGLDLDPKTLEGGIYSSLGLIYFEVPGKPLGFGDKELAKTFLLKGIEISNGGMIANYFTGQYYFNEKEYNKALAYFEAATKGNFQENREIAKAGTLKEINQWIKKTKEKLN